MIFNFFLLDEVAQVMKEASKDPNTRWTLADLKTAVWLVENGHLTQLEKPVLLARDLDIASVSKELEIIRRVASVVLSKSDKKNSVKQQGQAFVYSRSFEES